MTNNRVEEIKEKATNYMNSKLGCIWNLHVKEDFHFGNGGVATIKRDYIGGQDWEYVLEYEGDELCRTTNPYSCGWALYVLGCEERCKRVC